MKVKIVLNRGRYIAGSEIDVPEVLARQLIDSGIGEAVKGSKKKPVKEGKTNVEQGTNTRD